MSGFDAGVVEKLDYNFRNGVEGTIKEPSDQQIGAFLDGVKRVFTANENLSKVGGMDENASPEEMLGVLNNLTGEDFVKTMSDVAKLYSDLCSGSPSLEQLLAVPLRVRVGFYAWLQAEVVNPEVRTAAGNGQVVNLPTAARG